MWLQISFLKVMLEKKVFVYTHTHLTDIHEIKA